MEKERIQPARNSRTIQQRNAGSANIMDNRPDGSRNYLSGHPLQRVEDDEEEDVLQGKLSAPAQRVETEEDEDVTQRKAGERSATEDVIQCFNLLTLHSINPKAVGSFQSGAAGKYSFQIVSDAGQFAPIDIYHISAELYDPTEAKKRVTRRKAESRRFSTLFFDRARNLYAIGVHTTGNSYYIQEIDPMVPNNAFRKGMVVRLGKNLHI